MPDHARRRRNIASSVVTRSGRAAHFIRAAAICALMIPTTTHAAPDPSEICEVAARHAATATGVPLAVLRAIALTETGRQRAGAFRPWPWTVNMEGKGHWFDDPDGARTFAEANHGRGARSFDVGCFQLNYKWHGHAFRSIRHMFDPQANALYAARFLARLYAEKGSWKDAAGAYHSRTPTFAQSYSDRFARILARLDDAPADARPTPLPGPVLAQNDSAQSGPLRVNLFPLLRGGSNAARNFGSLFPDQPIQPARRLIGGS